MNDPQNDHPGTDDFEDGPIVAEQQVTISRAQEDILGHEGAALGTTFQAADLVFQPQDKGSGRIWVVLGNIVPDGRDIQFGGGGDFNPVFSWHV